MSSPEIVPVLGEAVGHLLAFVLTWAALFFLGPVACLVALVLQLAGLATPPGTGWLYGATAAAWLLALGAHVVLRALVSAATRASAALAALFGRVAGPRQPRVVYVDAATGTASPPSWDWGAAREAEFREWAHDAMRARAAAREREAARASAAAGAWSPPPPASAPPPSASAQPRRPSASPPPRSTAPPPRAQAPPPPPSPREPDPYEVLGLPRGATQHAIRHAYRELIKQYHPDRVAGMPKEFQAIAHDKTRQIREAYEKLKRRAPGR